MDDVDLNSTSSSGVTKAWTQLLGSTSGDVAKALTVGRDGSIYIAGKADGNL